jgi:hypothetical protein
MRNGSTGGTNAPVDTLISLLEGLNQSIEKRAAKKTAPA